MKKLFMGILLALFIASAMVSCGEKDEYAPPTGYVLASNEDADYCLYVPDEWVVDFTTAAAGAYYSKSDPSSVSVMAWNLEYSDSSLDDWWSANKEDIAMVFSDVEVVSEENTTLDELYAKRYVYTATLGENRYKFLQEACIKNGYVYVFTYSSIEDNYDAHMDEVEEILSFVRIK